MNVYLRSMLPMILAGLLSACSGDMSGNKEVEEAKNYFSADKPNAAVIELKNALQKNGDNVQARWLLGEFYFRQGANDDALKQLLKALELGQAKNDVFPLLAQIYLAQNNFDSLQALSAEEVTDESLSIVQAAQGLGKLYSGNMDEASTLIEQAVATAPTTPFVLVAQARLKGVESKGDWDSVKGILKKAVEIDPGYVTAWSLLGDIELQGLNLKAAEDYYTRVIEEDSNRLEDRYKRGLVRLQNENLDGAAEDAAELLKRAPKSPGGHYLQGILLFREGNLKDAVTELEIAQAQEDRYPMSLFYLATANNMLGNGAQAEDYAYRYLAIAPHSMPGRKLLASIKSQAGNYVEAEELVRPVVEANGEDVEALNMLAAALLKQGKTEEALAILSKVVALRPNSPDAQTRLGAGLLASGEVSSSLKHIETALKLDPEFDQADLLLVSAFLRKGDVQAALDAVDAFEAKNPDSVAPHNLRGEVFLTLEKREESRKSFNKSLSIDADDVTANDRLAFLSIQEKDYEDARSRYNTILNSHPDHLSTLLKLAALMELQRDYDGMEKQLTKAVNAHPNDVEPRVMLARLHLTQGQPEQVAVDISTLDKTAQNQPDVLNVRGLAYLNQSKYQDAKATFEHLIALRPDAPQPHYHLGKAYVGLGEAAKARAEFEQSIEMAPGYMEPRLELTRALLREKDKSGVEKHIAILKQIAPEHPEVLQLEAVNAMFDGEPQKALALSKQAFDIAPTARNMLVVAQQHWVMGERDTARKMMEEWVAEHPKDMAVRLELATLYLGLGSNEKAVDEYKSVLKVVPKNLVSLNNLAWLMKDSDPKKALDYAEQAVSLDDQSPSTLDTYAVVLLKNGQLEKAERTIDRVISKSSDIEPAMHYHKALIANAMGKTGLAIDTLQNLLKADNNFADRKEAEQLLEELKSGK